MHLQYSDICTVSINFKAIWIFVLCESFNLAGHDVKVDTVLLSCQKSRTAFLVSMGVIHLPALAGCLSVWNAPNRSSCHRDRNSTSTWSASEPMQEIISVKSSASLLFHFLVFGVIGVEVVDSLNFSGVSCLCTEGSFFCFEFWKKLHAAVFLSFMSFASSVRVTKQNAEHI